MKSLKQIDLLNNYLYLVFEITHFRRNPKYPNHKTQFAMKTEIILCFVILVTSACSSPKRSVMLDFGSPTAQQTLMNEYVFEIRLFSDDPSYGYTKENPIMVGGGVFEGAQNQRRFLNALAGPSGEQISYTRLGSCCHFKTDNSSFGDTGLLDMYAVTYDGLDEQIILFLNMYDSDLLKVPVGFTLIY